ncbi:MAG: ring-cleaving dioxygenase [Acholeplasmataceae bacterium]
MELKGIHHITSITSDALKIYNFFTVILGLRLVKKTINQDDVNTYHLFFADKYGNPGTDITFFDFKGIKKGIHGNNSINRTSFIVPNEEALNYFIKRFNHYNVSHQGISTLFNKKIVYFNDFDGALYALVSDDLKGNSNTINSWENSPVPNQYQITGLGPVFINVSKYEDMDYILTKILNMRQTSMIGNLFLYEMGKGGNNASLIINYNEKNSISYQGYGSVHHLAFRVGNRDDLIKWIYKLNELGIMHSGFIDRFYFYSVYVRLYLNILFELATDEPGFIDDEENFDTLGDTLALPPKFREHRQYIESIIKPLNTKKSSYKYEKEYFDEKPK